MLSSSSCIDSSNNQANPGAHSVTVSSTDTHSTNNNVSSNLNPDPPVVHKRARDSDNHEDSKVGWSNDVEQDQQQQQEHTPKRQRHQEYSTPSQTPWTSMQHPAPTPTPTQPQSSSTPTTTTVDVHCTPGGSTPAMTPRMAVTANGFRINSFNIHRLLITCLMVAAKFTSDLFYSNARYAKVGGLSLLELNQLELEFLFTTRFELNVKVEELQRVGNALLRFRQQLAMSVRQSRSQVNLSQNGPLSTTTTTAIVNEDTASNVINAAQANSNDGKIQQGKAGRFSIPSPTSPKNGPMSDRAMPSTSSASTLAHVATATASSTSASQADPATVVIASGSMNQRAQLLSPPEEKQKWAESEVQESEESVDSRQNTTSTESTMSSHTSSAP
ncbi:hypothetical protein BGZ51_009341 [Haplosporangium sp. Z 767]|nr:hypothetical protein BGZ50_002374 [Haplosporangium sp. Z 11]KAF9189700.1 hypothetical protein BGZ51_009341 [Haplosporangium sp. Z 767]